MLGVIGKGHLLGKGGIASAGEGEGIFPLGQTADGHVQIPGPLPAAQLAAVGVFPSFFRKIVLSQKGEFATIRVVKCCAFLSKTIWNIAAAQLGKGLGIINAEGRGNRAGDSLRRLCFGDRQGREEQCCGG